MKMQEAHDTELVTTF